MEACTPTRIVYDETKVVLRPGMEGQRTAEEGTVFEWIQGYLIASDPMPEKSEMENYGLPVSEQYFRRTQVPDFMLEPVYNADDDIELSEQQSAWLDREIDRRLNGCWYLIKGIERWLPGDYYFELNYCQMRVAEGDRYKEYRDMDRRGALFWQMIQDSLRLVGEIKSKKRREGATLSAVAATLNYITLGMNRYGGILADKKDRAESDFDMLKYMFEGLPWFFQPVLLNSSKEAKELHFDIPSTAKKTKHKGGSTFSRGLNSKIDYAPGKASHYDGKQLHRMVGDEWGKSELMSVTLAWGITKKCFTLGGDGRIIGKARILTTVEELGASLVTYKILWDNSSPKKLNRFGTTPSGLLQVFFPSDDGLEGWIDKYGDSVYGRPDKEQAEFIIAKNPGHADYIAEGWGALEYVKYVVSLPETEAERIAERRRLPLTERDIFGLANSECPFPLAILDRLGGKLDSLNGTNLLPSRRVNLSWADKARTKVTWQEDEKGRFEVWYFPEPYTPQEEGTIVTNMGKMPVWKLPNLKLYIDGGADPFKGKGTVGSNGGITGFAPYRPGSIIPTPSIIFYYEERPETPEEYWEDCVMAAHLWGARFCPEDNIYGVVEYFRARGYENYLWTREELTGVRSEETRDRFGVVTTGTAAGTINDLIAGMYHFIAGTHHAVAGPNRYKLDTEPERCRFQRLVTSLTNFTVEERTKHDGVMSALMAIYPSLKVQDFANGTSTLTDKDLLDITNALYEDEDSDMEYEMQRLY